jgi:L-alanine-DL-glutamate epimerase-like enolase superfamily enzyme
MAFRLTYKTFELPFVYPFTISKGTKTHQPTLIVQLHWNGWVGLGESPAIHYYGVTVPDMVNTLEAKRGFIEKFAFTEPERYWHYLHHLLPNDPFLVNALDMAAWDLFRQLKRTSLSSVIAHRLQQAHQLTPLHSSVPITDYTIGLAPIDEMLEKIRQNPWPIYKIKLGGPHDIPILKAVRAATDAVIRVDANAGWTLEEAIQLLPELAAAQVELIEQPLAKDNWEGMKQLYALSSIPLIADESCVFSSDVKKCVGHFHGINIKLTKCSGISPALGMLGEARSLGLKTMIGSMNECSVGTRAIAALSPFVDFIDADGPLLLAEDPGKGLVVYEDHRAKSSS